MTAWPWPADGPLDRARRIALSYREHLTTVAPDVAAQLDARFTDLGEPWVAPVLVTVDPDEWVTVDVAAEHTSASVWTIYKWADRRDGRLTRSVGHDGRLRVRLGDVLDAQADVRRARAAGRS